MTTALLLKIGAESSQLRGDLAKANSLVNQFTSKIGAAGGAIAGALTVGAVTSFIAEVSKLSAEAQGVRYAFDKIGGSVKLLHDLKEATHGTVSELELMKNAVAFKNFNLDVSQLPKLLEFATLRAQQTGQSVDYLVQSIVTGLGRKSVLILDNLGISAAALNEEVAKTGDFFGAVGTIVDREITNMGEHIENNITKTERLSASWTNFKVAVGDAANGTGVLGGSLDVISDRLDVLASKDLSWWEKLAGIRGDMFGGNAALHAKMIAAETARVAEEQRRHTVTVEIATEAVKKYGANLEEITKAYKDIGGGQEVIAEAMRMINSLTEKQQTLIQNEKNLTEQLNKKKEDALSLTGHSRAAINDEIIAIEAKIEALRKLSAIEQPKVKALAPIKRDSNPLAGASALDMSTIGGVIDSLPEKFFEMQAAYTANLALMTAAAIKFNEQQEFMATVAMTSSEAIGEAIGAVAVGQQSALQSIASVTSQIVDLFAKRAIAAAIANAAAAGGPFPFASVVLATAAAASMKALLGRVGASVGGGGGGGSRGGGSSQPGGLTKIKYGERMEISGEFKVAGSNLVAVIDNENRKQGRTKP